MRGTLLKMDARMQLIAAQKANGVLDEFTSYAPESGQMEYIETYSNNNGNQQHSIAYTYDPFGNLDSQSVVNIRDGNSVLSTELYEYDELHRLTKSDRTVAGISMPTYNYSYDTVGNLLSKDDYGNGFTYGNTSRSNGNAGPNAIYQINQNERGITNYSYDDNGNMVSGDGRNIVYNAFNKPLSITKNNITSDFYYGADQMRYKQVKNNVGIQEQTTFIYVDKVYEEIREGDTVQKKLYLGDTIITEKQVSTSITYNKSFIHRDRLGSVVTVTDEFGNVIDNKSYDPFGKPRLGTMENVDPANVASLKVISSFTMYNEVYNLTNDIFGLPTILGFTGHEHLDDAELIHMNGRVYDYNLGRFLSVDPFIQEPGNSQSMNPYSYIMNNPLAGTDPSGYIANTDDEWEDKRWTTAGGGTGTNSSKVFYIGMAPDDNGSSELVIRDSEMNEIILKGESKANINISIRKEPSVISTRGGTESSLFDFYIKNFHSDDTFMLNETPDSADVIYENDKIDFFDVLSGDIEISKSSSKTGKSTSISLIDGKITKSQEFKSKNLPISLVRSTDEEGNVTNSIQVARGALAGSVDENGKIEAAVSIPVPKAKDVDLVVKASVDTKAVVKNRESSFETFKRWYHRCTSEGAGACAF